MNGRSWADPYKTGDYLAGKIILSEQQKYVVHSGKNSDNAVHTIVVVYKLAIKVVLGGNFLTGCLEIHMCFVPRQTYSTYTPT